MRLCCSVAAASETMPVTMKAIAIRRTERSARAEAPRRLRLMAPTTLSTPKPKLISESDVRIQAIRVRSAASRLRSFASSLVMFMTPFRRPPGRRH